MFPAAETVLLALSLDALLGDPPALWRRLPHPVALAGAWIGRLERRLNDPAAPDAVRRRRGAGVAFLVVGGAAAAGALLHGALLHLPGGWIVEGVAASTLFAARSLHEHVRAVALALDTGLEPARDAVAHIVGRDPRNLDAAGVARAAVESAAENYADGVLAPLLWYCLLGLPGIAGYKALNTLDSMIGHRDPRHAEFGRAAARLDDVANFVPARLAAAVLALAAACLPGASAGGAVRAAWRDAGRHRSVNAGWPEAAMAGALGFRIAGPRSYGGTRVDDAWMGDGRADLGARDVHRALRLYLSACLLAAAGALAALTW